MGVDGSAVCLSKSGKLYVLENYQIWSVIINGNAMSDTITTGTVKYGNNNPEMGSGVRLGVQNDNITILGERKVVQEAALISTTFGYYVPTQHVSNEMGSMDAKVEMST